MNRHSDNARPSWVAQKTRPDDRVAVAASANLNYVRDSWIYNNVIAE